MSNFLTRLVDRTLGLGEVVKPLVKPLFANEVTFGDSFPKRPHVDGKTLDLDGKVEDTKFTERDTSITSRANIPLVNPEPTRTVITGKSSQYERSFDKQTNSKGNIASEADKLINNNPLIPKKDGTESVSSPCEIGKP